MDHQLMNAKTYLLTWNPGKFGWEDFQEDWDAFYAGSRPRLRWSCGNTKSIHIGDRVFLMRLGYRENIIGILASGVVTQPSFEDTNWNDEGISLTAWYVEFEPDILLNPHTDELLNPLTVSSTFNWHPQRSGVTIPSNLSSYLEEIWLQHVQRKNVIEAANLFEETESKPYREGSRTLVTSYRYERDPKARESCLRYYGRDCTICGFNFGEVFGATGQGFIHIHHLTPISERYSEYVVDPIQDLRPVCPNCHAMLHRRIPPYSIDELKVMRKG